MPFRFLIIAAIAVAFGVSVEVTDGPHGRVRVIDADTFDVGETRVRLHGVDAPEKGQTCLDAEGMPWDCGAWATERARARWEGRVAACEELDRDRYGRSVSRCLVNGRDVGSALVSGGVALAYRAYSTDYVIQEMHAQGARIGIWQGEFQRPEDYRREPMSEITNVEMVSAPEGCLIKGNVSGAGRVYHIPGGRNYEATEIDTAAGERWFCSPAEAEAAGWRPARR